MGTFAWGLSLDNFRLGSFAWEASFGIVRLGTFAWDLSLGNFRLGSFAWELSLGIFRVATSAWELSCKNFRLGSFAWKLSLGNFGSRISGLGKWSPEAGGTGWRTLGEPGGTGSPDRVFKILNKNPSG